MAKQLVLSGNRVVARGEDCFITAGNTVFCPDTGAVYENATIATYDCECPDNVLGKDYTFERGEFVPHQSNPWKTLADVTLPETVDSVTVELNCDLLEYGDALVVWDNHQNRGASVRINGYGSYMSTSGEYPCVYPIHSIFKIPGEFGVAVPCASGNTLINSDTVRKITEPVRHVSLAGYNTSYPLPAGARIIILAR